MKDRGGTNVWSMMTVDVARSMVFLPLTSPSYDTYGGDRKGTNLYGNSVVALDCKTGTRRWHYQVVHHDLWDYDLPAAPVLADVKRDGKVIPAVAQVTKMGFLFLLNRETGEPLSSRRRTAGAEKHYSGGRELPNSTLYSETASACTAVDDCRGIDGCHS